MRHWWSALRFGATLWYAQRSSLAPIRLLSLFLLAASLIWETIEIGSYALTHDANGVGSSNPTILLVMAIFLGGFAIPATNIALWTLCLSHAAQLRLRRWFISLLLCVLASYMATEILNDPYLFIGQYSSPGAFSAQMQFFLFAVAPGIVFAVMPVVALVYSYHVRPEGALNGTITVEQTAASDDDFVVERIEGAGAFRLPTQGWLSRR